MITITYILLIALPILLALAIWRAVVGDRDTAMRLLVGAIALGIVAALLAFFSMRGAVNATGYARAEAAARRSDDADAALQVAMADNSISVAEYAAIASAYEQDTGQPMDQVEGAPLANGTDTATPAAAGTPAVTSAISSDTTLPAPSAGAVPAGSDVTLPAPPSVAADTGETSGNAL